MSCKLYLIMVSYAPMAHFKYFLVAIQKINKAIRKKRDAFFTSAKADDFKVYLTDEYWIHE